MRVTRKIVTRAAANLFFCRFSGDILFSSLVYFAFFVFLFCFVFLLVCLFFEIKNIYSDTHSTMRAGESPGRFPETTTFFGPIIIAINI